MGLRSCVDAALTLISRHRPRSGVAEDLQGRASWYKHDWLDGINAGYRIFAPSTYIFFCSAIPALAFGQQLYTSTDGVLTAVQVLAATAICGTIQAIFGGQPLLIVGVAEPIVLIYGYMYSFARDRKDLGPQLFLAWAAWVCVWAAAMIAIVAMSGACRLICRFTRFSGELFGMLIAVLFLQEAIKGLKQEFRGEEGPNVNRNAAAEEPSWRLVNGLWALVLAFGLLYTSLKIVQARAWRYYNGALRSFLADYGVPLMVVVWTGLSFALRGTPHGIPRRTQIPNTWDVKMSWTVAKDMGSVPGTYVAAALIPALIITVLFYFDHSVSSQLAQQAEFNLVKPSAYSYDLLLLGGLTLLCGLIGVPPVNGVLPQAPMHTRSLTTLKQQLVARQVRKDQRTASTVEAQRIEVASGAAAAVGPKAPPVERAQPNAISTPAQLSKDACLADGPLNGHAPQHIAGANGGWPSRPTAQPPHIAADNGDFEGRPPELVLECGFEGDLPVGAQEQRMSGLIQSLLVGACLGITLVIKQIPTSVLWGYFAYMALDSLEGSQFWDRMLLLLTDPKRRSVLQRTGRAPYLEGVKFRVIVAFTLLQFAGLAGVYGITLAGIAGVVFPIPIMLLVPLRIYVLPRLFRRADLHALDAAVYHQSPPGTPKSSTSGSDNLTEMQGADQQDSQKRQQPAQGHRSAEALDLEQGHASTSVALTMGRSPRHRHPAEAGVNST
ncbi:hypothetical protein WJX72_000529 [[Myrmecia] bisecta]|uniref:Bicarbonate transporter-like transmembrane domain-containing protein n=1 Tax=[Myrmecia] bisecta TaxID=41462 RepID=A0AAW1PCM8_9CHLO